MIKPITVSPNELNALFDTHIKPLYDRAANGVDRFHIYSIVFDNHYPVSPQTYMSNAVRIYISIFSDMIKDLSARDAFRAYFNPFLGDRESVTCLFNCSRQRVQLYLNFDSSPSDCFQSNPYQNQNVILALQVLRERAAQLNP